MPARGRTPITALVVVLVMTTATFVRPDPAAASATATPVSYQSPVDAPITDPFRPPANPWEPGNRGIEYGIAPGTLVEAAADGEVTFAGPVAGVLWVTIGHADGVRTTYGPLASVGVAQGEKVRQGEALGTTAGRMLLTARQNGEYIDPERLLTGGGIVRLLPTAPAVDLHGLWKSDPAMDAFESTLEWIHTTQPDVVGAVAAANGISFSLHVAQDLDRWRRRSESCTNESEPPPRPESRRAAILVGGLGSSSEPASIDRVPTASLGYAATDVMRFSYRGGRTPTDATVNQGELAAIPSTAYAPEDTLGDLRDAGERLAQLIIAAAAALPANVSLDVIAHSQGGLVTRVAVGIIATRRPEVVPRLGLVATIATPHHGAPLAEIASLMADDPRQAPALDAVRAALGERVDPGSAAVHDLAPGSAFLHELDHTALPDTVPFLSIGARGDLVVPLPSTELDGAAHATVSVAGVTAHDEITSSDGVTRELALAIAGRPPTCDRLIDAIADSVSGRSIEGIEATVAAFRP